jgi:selenocysteine lyase/cysteine desulfurase
MNLREEFSIQNEYVYLNTAATSPLPRHVINAVSSFMELRAACAESAWDNWIEHVTIARDRCAALMGASREEIAFLKNTGDGLNTVCAMLPSSGNVVTTDAEFPSNVLPWSRRQREVRMVSPRSEGFSVDDFEQQIDDETVAVTISEVTYNTGVRLPTKEIAEVAHDHGAIVVSDAVQALGAVTMDVRRMGIDVLCCGGHKWLMSPFGVGIFYISREMLQEAEPPFVGWASLEDDTDFSLGNTVLASSARRFEIGNLNFSGIYGLSASVGRLLDYGPDVIEDELLTLSGYLYRELESEGVTMLTPYDARAGIITIDARDPKALVSELAAQRIVVAQRGGVRVSPHVWNTKEELDAAVEAIVAADAR